MSAIFYGVGMNGVVQVTGTAVANLKNASFSIKNDTVEEFVCNGGLHLSHGACNRSALRNQGRAALHRQHNDHSRADSRNSSYHNRRTKWYHNRQTKIHFHWLHYCPVRFEVGSEECGQQQL